jgi:hypothetical protein
MARREFKGAPVATTITAGITSGSASFSINASTGWPTGAVGPFAAVLDIGTASEEKVLCSLLSAGVLTVTTRGYDGTTATAHNLGATISNIPTSVDFDEANAHVQLTAGVHGTTGTIVGTTDTQTLTNKTLSLPIITENIKRAFAATVTAAATTTLTVNSAEQQQFTGTTTQTVALPVVSTLALGMSYTILNDSTGVVTVQSSGANTILAMGANTKVTYTCVLITGTTAASWSTPAVVAGGMTLLSTTAITAATSITPPTISQAYTDLLIVCDNFAIATAGNAVQCTINGIATGFGYNIAGDALGGGSPAVANILLSGALLGTNNAVTRILIPRYAVTTSPKLLQFNSAYVSNTSSNLVGTFGTGYQNANGAVTQFTFKTNGGNFTAQGNIYIYGVN